MAKTLLVVLSTPIIILAAACASQPLAGGGPQRAPSKVEWKLVESGVLVKTDKNGACKPGSSFIGPDGRKYVCTGTQKVANCKSKKTGEVVHDGPCTGDE